ncbi:hypothetical protein CEXT_592761, partial [Caerostris extrusa]
MCGDAEASHVASAHWIITASPKMCDKVFVLLIALVAVISSVIGVGKADQLHK